MAKHKIQRLKLLNLLSFKNCSTILALLMKAIDNFPITLLTVENACFYYISVFDSEQNILYIREVSYTDYSNYTEYFILKLLDLVLLPKGPEFYWKVLKAYFESETIEELYPGGYIFLLSPYLQ